MSTALKPNPTNAALTKALDVCAAIVRRALACTDKTSEAGDRAAIRIAWVADAINQVRCARMSVNYCIEVVQGYEPREFNTGDSSGAAVKHACMAIVTILDAFDS